ncbi:hypothetical protein GOP47_0022922 [Adiantum capillus-veneris]|uniref:Protein kinase domain-containing protein n=1 Tax=Adiantum capillus-veneris TaxID=13818 RepID=A0A9D4U6H9_ADICA|nr:hypothetical protein GOP47_0022922 [Adiantum capillus-veneris]
MTSSELTLDEVKWRPSFRAYGSVDQQQLRGRRRLKSDPPIVVKLTRDIIQTFQCCNASFSYEDTLNPKRFLTNPSVPASNGGLDNENNDLILAVNGVLVNEHTNRRYIIKDLLGHGTFGQVAKCWGDEVNSFVAIKVIKNHPAYRQQAIVEISILNLLNGKYDPDDKHHIVRIFEHFMYKEHLCMVFEMLGLNLFELLRANNLRGISLNLIRSFSKQILTALSVLRDASVIHCDLKLENILLTTCLASAELKIIDFGSACREYRTIYSYIQSRFYRSPEVVLGHEYTAAIDMWSFGCIAAELFLGLPLFPAQSQYDLLQRMMNILRGRPPDHILKNSKNTSKYFKQTGAPSRYSENSEGHRSAYQFLSPEDYEKRETIRPAIGKHYFSEDWDLEMIILSYPMKKGMQPEEIEEEVQKRLVFLDFIKGLVNFDPSKRWTPRQAAQHPFVTQRQFTGSFQPPLEAPRMPTYQGMNVDHNPVSGHWLGAGLSPQFGSPHYYGHHLSYGSSHGSAETYGSYGDSLVESFGDPSRDFLNHQSPSAILHPCCEESPDTWRHVGHISANKGVGHTYLGMSPSSNFLEMSLGVSPSNFTPSNFTSPTSHLQHSSVSSPSFGSPGRYGPTSPARSSGGGASSLGKVAALGQFNKRRGFGSLVSASNVGTGGQSGGFESSSITWNGIHPNTLAHKLGSLPSSYNEGTSPLTSPRSFSEHGAQLRARSEMMSGPVLEQTQASKPPTYPTGSLGALISNAQSAGDDVSASNWDPNFSEDLLLESDEAETQHGSIQISPGERSGQEGLVGLNVENPTRGTASSYVTRQDGPQFSAYRQSSHFPYLEGGSHVTPDYGWGLRHLHLTHQAPQHISPSRLGQQSTQILLQQQQQLHQYSSFNLSLYEQLPHFVHQNLGSSQSFFQGPMNVGLPGAFSPTLSTKNS